MDKNMVGIRAEVSSVVMTRIRALYTYIYELAEALGVDQYALESIRRGILERQIIKTIIVYYLDSNSIVIGKILIEIDWKKHEALASTDDGKEFVFDRDRPLLDQINDIANLIIEHIEQLRVKNDIAAIETSYRYVDEITNDDDLHDAARNYMEHVKGYSRIERIDPNVYHTISAISDIFSEVKITVANKAVT